MFPFLYIDIYIYACIYVCMHACMYKCFFQEYEITNFYNAYPVKKYISQMKFSRSLDHVLSSDPEIGEMIKDEYNS